MQESRSGLRIGDLVEARGASWCVADVTAFPRCDALSLTGIERANLGVRRRLLYPFDRPRKLARDTRVRLVSRRRWMRALAGRLAEDVPCGALRAAAFARVRLLEYQLEPAIAAVRGDTRILIADEVGLGKTIQAGLVLAELRARGEADRALILTPAGLREQWAQELVSRFDISVIAADAWSLRRSTAALPRGVNPWTIPGTFLASLDFVKQPEVLQALAPITWDVLLVDEAHAAGSGSERASAVRALAGRSRRVLLLTATPHAGDEAAFAALCDLGRIGNAPGEGPILLFRRSRADAGVPGRRRTRRLVIRQTGEERRMHDLLDRYVRQVRGARIGGPAALLAMVVLKKRALSSAGSLAESVRRRLALLASGGADPAAQLALPFQPAEEEETDDRDRAPSAALAAPGLEDRAREREWLALIHDAAVHATEARESKARAIVRLLARVREPAIVFTEFRDTLCRLAAVLTDAGEPPLVLHGGLAPEARAAPIEAFVRGEARVLLATDAGSEGLNLHARCRLVVSVELPWNPMRLEQRIGRVDRLGQARAVHAILLVARGTGEADVLARLAARLDRVRAAVGCADDLLGAASEAEIERAMLANRDEGKSGQARASASIPGGQRGPRIPRAASTAQRHTPAVNLGPAADAELRRLALVRAVTRFTAEPGGGAAVESAGRLMPAEVWSLATADDGGGPLALVVRARQPQSSQAAGGGRADERDRRETPAPAGLPPAVSGLLLLYKVALLDHAGRLVEQAIFPVHLRSIPIPRARPMRAARGLIDAVVAGWGERALREVRAAVDHRLAVVTPGHLLAIDRLQARERALLGALISRRTLRTTQPGLFDHRALQAAERDRSVAEAIAAEREGRIDRLERARLIAMAADPRLVLVLAASV